MDEIRERVAARMKSMGVSANALSSRLNRGSTYMHDWLTGKKDTIPYEMKRAIAEALRMEPADLGIALLENSQRRGAGGFAEDAEGYSPAAASPLSRVPHIAYFKMKSRALDQHSEQIVPGDLLAFNINKTRLAEIQSGKVVVAQLYDKRELTVSHGTIIRIFLAPNKLITNASSDNEILRLDDPALPYEIVIKGTLAYITREVN